MAYKIVTEEARTLTAEDVVDDVGEVFGGEYVYYVFLGKHTSYDTDNDNPVKPQDAEKYKRQVYNDMLFGKKITENDIRLMIDRHDYVAGTVYDMYDDTDKNLFSKNFFVSVANGPDRDVFKCLSNYGGSPSLYAPNKDDIEDFDEIYRLADGYVWKYMYTIPQADMEKFATAEYIPVISNTSVSSAANNGSIDVIVVESGGSGYNNYLYGTLGKNDLNVDSNPRRIDVSGNNKSSTSDDFYKGCIFKIVSGTGIGSYAKIESYDVYGSHRVITLNDDLTLEIDSEYEITPEVKVVGDFTQTTSAVARAIVNSSANTIDYVEILDKGLDYKRATAYVYSSSVVPVTANSVVRPIIGPFGGHGYDANNELGSSRVCFSTTFNEDIDLLPSVNDFRQVGIISNPKFANVSVNFSSKDTTDFISGEKVWQINPVRLFGETVTTSTSSNSITASSAQFEDLEPNTIIYIVGSSSKQLATIQSVTNSTHLVIDTYGNFACNDCEIYLANVSCESVVVNDIYNGVAVSNLTRPYLTGNRLVGYDSGASGVVSDMEINEKTSTLSKFTQMWRYVVNTDNDFEEDEIVYQPESAANSQGYLFGLVEDGSNTVMYLSNPTGYINTSDNVTGLTSEDTAYVVTSYEPELIYNSGRIIYLENLEKVTRTAGQKETFKIIFSY